MRRPPFLLVVAIAMAACTSHRPRSADPQGEFTLIVVNHHWLDVTVYVLHDGQRSRVGTVTATTTEQFTVSAHLLGSTHQLVLIGEAVGSREAVRTEVLSLLPGQYIEWTLENALRRSSVAVY